MRIAIVPALLCALLAATTAQASTELIGVVRTVNINKTWGGILIQLEGAPVFESGSACANTFAFSATSDELTNHLLAAALAAKATGEQIRIATSGCVTSNHGLAPKIEWLDFGSRI